MAYYKDRLKFIEDEMEKGMNPYPHNVAVSLSIRGYIDKYAYLQAGDVQDVDESVAGRVMTLRNWPSTFIFHIHGDCLKLQVVAKESTMNKTEFSELASIVKRGDLVRVQGFPGKTEKGVLTLYLRSFTLLSRCLHLLPKIQYKPQIWLPGKPRSPGEYVLKDPLIRTRQRYLDMIVNEDVAQIFKARHKIILYIRKFLDSSDFVEVETSMMNMIAGGGAAKPFVTSHDVQNTKQYMRIAPELYLKQLVVGGMERVYEIGKQFRNESINMTHNPEFTSCNFYMSYVDYEDLMKMTEEMLSGLVMELTGGYKISYHADGYNNEPIEIDFTPPYRKIDMLKTLKEVAQLEIPEDLASEEAYDYLTRACANLNVNYDPPSTTGRLLEKLVGKLLEGDYVNPIFIMNHPVVMTPMAKEHRSVNGLTERFDLFIKKTELCNAYSDLNNPVVQRKRFTNQLDDPQSRNDNETYCQALEYGLPPTCGCAIGIDRLVMILTDSLNIKDVISFPPVRAKV